MDAFAGLGVILLLVCVVAALIFFLMVLSIAIDSARILRRLNKIIELLERRAPPPRI